MYDVSTAEILKYHHSMLQDKNRTQTFLRAILQEIKPGDVVLDVGCGTGILAYFACLAGAKHVYAIEQSPIIEIAKRVAQKNGVAQKITFIHEWSNVVELPEKVDVIITETIGNNGFEEGILGFLHDAKNRFLKQNGRMIPQCLTMHIVPIQAPKTYRFFDEWAERQYSLDYTPAHHVAANHLWWIDLEKASFLANAQPLSQVDLQQTSVTEYEGTVSFVAKIDGVLQGFGGYFSAQLAAGIDISNEPPNQTPSWAHTFFPMKRPLPIKRNDLIKIHILTKQNASHWEWHVTVGDTVLRHDTHRGLLHSEKSPLPLTFMPQQNQAAQLDLFIIELIDGSHTIADIIQFVSQKFPNRFSTDDALSYYVKRVVNEYGR